MQETKITSVLVIGSMARVRGTTRRGLTPLYFAQVGSAWFLGQGWSTGAGNFDITIGPLNPLTK